MPFAAALSVAPETDRAIDEVCSSALDRLDARPDLALLFFSAHHKAAVESFAAAVQARLGARCLLGCPGEAIVGNDQEIEDGAAVSLWLAQFAPVVRLHAFHLEVEKTAEGHSLLGWPDRLAEADPKQSAILLLGDPFSFPVDAFLRHVNENYPGLRVMGGMASGASEAGACGLLLGDQVLDNGAVGVLIEGSIGIHSIVSQGCRPIGRHLVVTRGKENIIAGLGGKPPLAQLQDIWQELSPDDRALCQHGLHLGRVINEYQGEFRRGDFLVRNVMGLDQDSGALAINDVIRVGQTVQFHVRDSKTADEDLRTLLQQELKSRETRPGGALLFTCNGRGTRLFPEAHHDARAIRAEIGNLPLAGFFAQGELGPVGGQNFIHGFTASVVLFDDQVQSGQPPT
jgi:small ligand-binding sensory domain FIST